MSKMVWDQTAQRLFETGVEQVALFVQDKGVYGTGVAWNGVTALNITPSGAEPTALWANDRKYLNLMSAEEIGATLEAYTYPDEFMACDGSATVAPGVYIGQQARKTFGLVAKTLIGNDTEGNKHGYKLHLLWGCLASTSEKAYATVNDSPEAITLSWEVTTTPVEVEGYEATAYMSIDSTKTDAAKLKALEAKIYGSESEEPSMPTPAEVISMMAEAAG